jgi:hypothetical protein
MSDRTDHLPFWGYNCIAWAAGKTDRWWWPISVPGAYWPIPIDPVDPVTLKQFTKAFESQGYSVCKNGRFENGFEKVAIYVDGTGEPTHAARMLETGGWSSKMGRMEDIEHETLQVLEGKTYGCAVAFLRRRNEAFRKPALLKRLVIWASTFLSRLFVSPPRASGGGCLTLSSRSGHSSCRALLHQGAPELAWEHRFSRGYRFCRRSPRSPRPGLALGE